GAVLVTMESWDVGEAADWQAGADATETALRLDPNLSLAHAVRGEVQLLMIPRRGTTGWDQSMESISQAIEIDGSDATALTWRAQNFAALGYLDRAIADNEQCLRVDPAYELCRRHAAIAYLYLGRTSEALGLLETGLEHGYLFNDMSFLTAIAER